ncbi:NAD-dependent epimerase/dehydratase family protein [Paenibacillus daejeonensis]|uniref:NAD-dependent epimerase/dehydratase family protein n=1 Tax=Paenibacillus daejeonensis TaxID=135193 RepID=UPI000375DBA8|nr:NAD(P)-dependent oxidoreductase [Paenibacillus daejeonensis]
MNRRKLLITGAAGKVGGSITAGLRALDRYDIIAADLEANRQEEIVELNVTDADRWLELTRGVDTVIHNSWAKDNEDFLGMVLPVNVTGAYHLYEAARINGVRRVVFASSNHAMGFYRVGEEAAVDDPYRPDSLYGLSKCYIELLGRYYSDKYDLSSINIRIGNFPGDDRPHSERSLHIWISDRDLVQLAACCVEADDSHRFLSLYGTSANTDNYYDIGYLAELIGYRPQDDAAELLAASGLSEDDIKQDETAFQGGVKRER